MIFSVVTLFPKQFDSFLETSLIARGIKKNLIGVKLTDLRRFGSGVHKSVDDRPYGGGPGMVLRVDAIDRALRSLKIKKVRTILLEPSGKPFTQKDAKRLAKYDQLILIAGHYEGVDERVRDLVDEEISIGDYVLTGGELPAMVLIEAVSRMIPGFLGKTESSREESFSLTSNSPASNLLEYPQYTRPEVYQDKRVPKILLTGNHGKIKSWRKNQSIQRTKSRRPDLLS